MTATIIIVIVAALLLVILWVLFVPFVISVNSDQGECSVYQPGTFLVKYCKSNTGSLSARVLGIPFSIEIKRPAKSIGKPRVRKASAHRSLAAWRRLINGIMHAFRLRQLVADVDTGDVVLNAQLVPAATFISRQRVSLGLNFTGHNYFFIELEGRMYRILWALILFTIKK